MIKQISLFAALELASKQCGKFIVYVSNGLDNDDTSKDGAERLIAMVEMQRKHKTIFTSETINLFDTEEEAFEFYNPFRKQPLADSEVFAWICSPTKGGLDENT